MSAPTSWAALRQVVLGTDDLPSDVARLRELLSVGEGFADPLLAELGMADHTVPVGPTAYLELVAPLRPDVPLARWLEKVGGAGGFALSVQVPDALGCLSRAQERGVRVVAQERYQGADIVQLHPSSFGVLLELDGLSDPQRWFWDELGTTPSPGARVDEVLGVQVRVADPEGVAALWHEVLGLAPTGRASTVQLGDRTVELLPAGAGPPGMTAVLLRSRTGAPGSARLAGVELRYA